MNPLAIFDSAPMSKYDDAAFDAMASAGGYLPRLEQKTIASGEVKLKKIKAGFYLVSGKDDRVLLGEDSVDFVPVAWRVKALETPSGGKPISSTDPESDLFKSIAARSTETNSNCQAGIEYLVWIDSVSKFATYLMGTKTGRREAAKIKPLMKKPVTVKNHTYSSTDFVWDGPKVYEGSVPPTTAPSGQLLADTVEKFLNPPVEVQPEKIEEAKTKRPR